MLILILLLTAIIDIFGGNIDLVPSYEFTTCTPTDNDVGYTCEEKTKYFIFDSVHVPRYNSTDNSFYIDEDRLDSLGAATYYDGMGGLPFFDDVTSVIVLGDTHGGPGQGKYDEDWKTPLMHEIQHVKCKCSWHPDP